MIKNPYDITLFACMFLRYWAGLYSDGDRELIKAGDVVVVQASIVLLKKSQEAHALRRILGGNGEGDMDNEELDVMEDDRKEARDDEA
jgi:hypothetical protein